MNHLDDTFEALDETLAAALEQVLAAEAISGAAPTTAGKSRLRHPPCADPTVHGRITL